MSGWAEVGVGITWLDLRCQPCLSIGRTGGESGEAEDNNKSANTNSGPKPSSKQAMLFHTPLLSESLFLHGEGQHHSAKGTYLPKPRCSGITALLVEVNND